MHSKKEKVCESRRLLMVKVRNHVSASVSVNLGLPILHHLHQALFSYCCTPVWNPSLLKGSSVAILSISSAKLRKVLSSQITSLISRIFYLYILQEKIKGRESLMILPFTLRAKEIFTYPQLVRLFAFLPRWLGILWLFT